MERSTTNSDTTAIDVSAQLREFRQAAYKLPLMTWELWLARVLVNDNPLAWQKQMTLLTLGRVA